MESIEDVDNSNDLLLEGGAGVMAIGESKKKKPRAYFMDWIRATAISLVIFVHTLGCSYDSTGYNRKEGWEKGEEKMQGIWKDLV